MKEQDCAVLAMEVSSIGLDMERLAGLYFDVAAFGNFSRDHLGFHGSMEKLCQSKAKLFTNHLYTAAQSTSKTSLSILNNDDAYASLIGNVLIVRHQSYTLEKVCQIYKINTPKLSYSFHRTTKEWFACLFEI